VGRGRHGGGKKKEWNFELSLDAWTRVIVVTCLPTYGVIWTLRKKKKSEC